MRLSSPPPADCELVAQIAVFQRSDGKLLARVSADGLTALTIPFDTRDALLHCVARSLAERDQHAHGMRVQIGPGDVP